MRGTRLVPVLLSLLAVACRYAGTPVPLRGTAADIAALAGRWDGEFSSDESRRRGSLEFTIRSAGDSAFGDVVLTPTMGRPVLAADAREPAHLKHSRAPEVLRIHLVLVEGAVVLGELEPYIAPDCECVVVTEFRGEMHGDRLEGTYLTRGPSLQQHGRWFMRRVPAD